MKMLSLILTFFIAEASFANGGEDIPPVPPESSSHHKACEGGFCFNTEEALQVVKGDCFELYASSPATIAPVQAIDPNTGEVLIEMQEPVAMRGPASEGNGPLLLYDKAFSGHICN